ncbi:hypothetical protein PVK06_007729 [Gossypium arboreum]|uniref:Uncharacterized protein n=1 Tax=Gossypium arboreum TaxID=29729 RepID=A0ABR0QI99_GOSAR|nr:hypothetical protein PVK06_007729 [Gossypium arboreum]
MIGPHYFVLTSLPPIITFSVNSRFVGHVPTKHAILSAPKTVALGGLYTHGHISEWPAESVTLPCKLGLRVGPATLPYELAQGESIALPCELVHLVIFSWSGRRSKAQILSRTQVLGY